jgi:hypothetical protein
VLAISFPRLASFALNSAASVKEVLEAEDLYAIFFHPLSQEAFQELRQLQEILPHLELDINSRDQWKPDSGKDYSVKKFYNLVLDLIQAHPIFKSVWKSRGTPRVKFFIWLILVDRLNTKTMLSRRHIGERSNDHYVLCNLSDNETLEHLFFLCPIAVQCWNRLGFNWDINLNLEDRLAQACHDSGLPFFLEASMIVAWELWKIRNDHIFNRQPPSQQRWFQNFKNQCSSQSTRYSSDLRSAFCFWLDALS